MTSVRESEKTAGATGTDPAGRPAPRELRDPREMLALAHPTRLALLEALKGHGPLTATQASELVGESPSSCSFHLRSLARYGFVEETGDGQGRQRPWRAVNRGLSLPGIHAAAEASAAADALTDLVVDLHLQRIHASRLRRTSEPAAWQEASSVSDSFAWLTPEELEELNQRVYELLRVYEERAEDRAARPEGARLVQLLYFAFPMPPSTGRGSVTPPA